MNYRNLLKQIHFGYASAETECVEEPNLLINGFLDQFSVISQTISGSKMLLLGNKGSGKSAVAERLRLLSQEKHDLFVTVKYLSSFPYKRFGRIIPGKDEIEIRYPRAWEMLLLISLLNSFIQDEYGLSLATQEFRNLITILEDNSLIPADDLQQLATKCTKNNFNIKIPIPIPLLGTPIEVSTASEKNQKELHLIEIPPFVNILLRTVLTFKSKSRHLIVIDGLDDVLMSKTAQTRIISALLLSAQRLNREFKRNKIGAHIVILCRTDLFESLPNPNKNKIRQDDGIRLNWYHDPQHPVDSGLVKLAELRSTLSGQGHVDIWHSFPSINKNYDIRKWLLDHTRHTPRDFLQLLIHIQAFIRQDESLETVTHSELTAGMRSYSLEYLLPEVRDGLTGLLDHDLIDYGLKVLGSMRKREFTFKDFADHGNSILGDQSSKDKFNDHEFISYMFQVGAIGNKTEHSSHVYYSFNYRNPNSSINYSEKFVIHRGLWKAWNLV